MSDAHFNLETAIATWRRFLRSERSITLEDADELESHLRDEIDALMRQGRNDEAAFGEAVRALGDYAMMERSYRQVYWKKVRSEHRVTDELQWRGAMLKNYLKIAVRNLRREKGYAFINIAGLAVGMACCLLILLFLQEERSYDRFHENADQIYRLTRLTKSSKDEFAVAKTAYAMGPTMQQLYPGIDEVVRFYPIRSDFRVRVEENEFYEDRLLFADSTMFDVFTFPLERGDPETALQDPYTMVLTEEMARKYFGATDPLGNIVTVAFSSGSSFDFKVTGVVRNVPKNSHIQFNFLVSMSSLREMNRFSLDGLGAWFNNMFYSYLLLIDGADPSSLEAQLPAMVEQYMGESLRTSNFWVDLHVQPLTDIHLYADVSSELEVGGDIRYVYLFSAIALFILLIACINFINLATARSAHRAREVGMRKVLGAHRSQLIRQFVGESMLLTVIALLLAVGLAAVLLPFFNTLTGKALSLPAFRGLSFWGGLVGVSLVVGLLAGSYPAFFLSAFRPVTVLKGSPRTGRPGLTSLRKALVILQYAISVVLIVGTTVIRNQLEYVQHKNLGFEQEQVVALPIKNRNLRTQYATVKQELLQHPNVLRATAAMGLPGQRLPADGFPVYFEGKEQENWMMQTTVVDHDFLETLEIELVAGRNFSRALPTDASAGFLLNETAVNVLGWEDPIGKKLEWEWGLGPEMRKRGEIIGVVKDYHYKSLHEALEPLILHIEPQRFKTIAVRIRAEEVSETLAFLEQTWQQFDPDNAFEYVFLDDGFAQHYEAEIRLGKIFGYFAVLAIVIAGLGLFGLAAFSAEQRTKEIGVRKVLGASVPRIVALLSRDFLLLVFIGFVVACPVAYLAMERWLEGFAYRTDLSVSLFVLAAALALVIALATVSYQAIKAALTDPVKSLRYE